jgi:hypothetical protein
MNDKLLKHGWDSYAEKVIPATMPAGLVEQFRLAYYAGAMVYDTVMDTVSNERTTEARGMEMISDLKSELKEFQNEVTSRSGAN